MQEIIILNSKYESQAREIANHENKMVLVGYENNNIGSLYAPNGYKMPFSIIIFLLYSCMHSSADFLLIFTVLSIKMLKNEKKY